MEKERKKKFLNSSVLLNFVLSMILNIHRVITNPVNVASYC